RRETRFAKAQWQYPQAGLPAETIEGVRRTLGFLLGEAPVDPYPAGSPSRGGTASATTAHGGDGPLPSAVAPVPPRAAGGLPPANAADTVPPTNPANASQPPWAADPMRPPDAADSLPPASEAESAVPADAAEPALPTTLFSAPIGTGPP
ncbi:MAG TPA: hypothetical protein VMB34_06705, partial [Acetobacteraceae bacterium]|nr:hypothetical protein [Acetobacteraceae bacterium]